MYVGVPTVNPTRVSAAVSPVAWVFASCSALAIPKSMIIAASPVSSTLSGFRSRWTMPRSCAWLSARATSRRMRTASRTDGSVLAASRSPSERPSMYGIEYHGTPSTSPAARTGTMCGCCRDAESIISRRNRSSDPTWPAPWSTFTTTSRSRAGSRATKTRDIPPPPSSRSTTSVPSRRRRRRSMRSSGAGGGSCGLITLQDAAGGRKVAERDVPASAPRARPAPGRPRHAWCRPRSRGGASRRDAPPPAPRQ